MENVFCGMSPSKGVPSCTGLEMAVRYSVGEMSSEDKRLFV